MRHNISIFALWASSLSASTHEAAPAPINWWHFGSEYANSPALGWYSLTFLIFVAGLIYYIKTPLSLYLQARAREISQAINEAQQAQQQAQAELKRSEEQLQQLDTQIAQLREDFRVQGELEKKRLLEDAEKLSERISAETKATIQAEQARIVQQLRNEISHTVISLSRERLANNTLIAEERLRSEFSNDLKTLSH